MKECCNRDLQKEDISAKGSVSESLLEMVSDWSYVCIRQKTYILVECGERTL